MSELNSNEVTLSTKGLNKLLTAICQKHNGPKVLRDKHTQPFYYGAAQSLNSDAEIVAIGTTPQEAMDRYVEYAVAHNLVSPWKLYPITHTLWSALKSTPRPPKVILLEDNGVLGVEVDAPIGVVDLAQRAFPYPSAAALYELMIEVFNTVKTVHPLFNDKLLTIQLFVIYRYPENTSTIFSIKTYNKNVKGKPTEYLIDVDNDIDPPASVPIEMADTRLFHFWNSISNVIPEENTTDLTDLTLSKLFSKEYQENMVDIKISFTDEVNPTLRIPSITINTVFPFADMPPLTSVDFTRHFNNVV